MQINKGDLLVLKRNLTYSSNKQTTYALVLSVENWYANGCECNVLINTLERKSHIFTPSGINWTKKKLIAHIRTPSRKEQKEKGINIGDVWGDFDVVEIIKGEKTCTSTNAK